MKTISQINFLSKSFYCSQTHEIRKSKVVLYMLFYFLLLMRNSMKLLIYLINDVIVFVRVEMVTEADCPADNRSN